MVLNNGQVTRNKYKAISWSIWIRHNSVKRKTYVNEDR